MASADPLLLNWAWQGLRQPITRQALVSDGRDENEPEQGARGSGVQGAHGYR